MPETYALHEGALGRAVVLELRDDLVAHAHAEMPRFGKAAGRSWIRSSRRISIPVSTSMARSNGCCWQPSTRPVRRSTPPD